CAKVWGIAGSTLGGRYFHHW
nr:immunoglobulin heavy chain junction region [Macaca mulatta]MOW99194.1 immunoglobulin heavy chain junction region [Macaca mulatta]MOW99336.1 immunoglobulin heavy chain junction region [Macaca mulatta]MOW99659.1 immunoglobulin heavy chain junction region [Macaca mulatta]MOW99673.1 immunoglobulin heavy chain junction region [Macaca mulatta]